MTSITAPEPIKSIQERLPVKQKQLSTFPDMPPPQTKEPGAKLDLGSGVAHACRLELEDIGSTSSCLLDWKGWSQCLMMALCFKILIRSRKSHGKTADWSGGHPVVKFLKNRNKTLEYKICFRYSLSKHDCLVLEKTYHDQFCCMWCKLTTVGLA